MVIAKSKNIIMNTVVSINNERRQMLACIRIVVLTAVLGLLAACDQNGQSDDVVAVVQTETIRLGIAMQPISALSLIAIEKDYFSAQGLDVKVTEYPSGKRALIEGLFTGKEDFASTADMPVTMAALQQRDLKVIASTFQADNINRIIARRDAGIESPDDLAGKRLATQKSSAVHYFLSLFLLEHGLSESDVELSFFKAEELPKALIEGRIDAFSMREPYISIARESLGENAIIFDAPGIYPQVDLMLTSGEMVTSRPGVISKFLKALLEAERFIDENTEKAIAITARRLGANEVDIANLWPMIRLRVEIEQSMLLLFEGQARWAIKQQLVKQTAIPNYLDYIYKDALHELNPQAVKLFH